MSIILIGEKDRILHNYSEKDIKQESRRLKKVIQRQYCSQLLNQMKENQERRNLYRLKEKEEDERYQRIIRKQQANHQQPLLHKKPKERTILHNQEDLRVNPEAYDSLDAEVNRIRVSDSRLKSNQHKRNQTDNGQSYHYRLKTQPNLSYNEGGQGVGKKYGLYRYNRRQELEQVDYQQRQRDMRGELDKKIGQVYDMISNSVKALNQTDALQQLQTKITPLARPHNDSFQNGYKFRYITDHPTKYEQNQFLNYPQKDYYKLPAISKHNEDQSEVSWRQWFAREKMKELQRLYMQEVGVEKAKDVISYKISKMDMDSSDEEALQLFQKLDPHQPQQQEPAEEPQMLRLKKSKRESKKEKQKGKLKISKLQKMINLMEGSTPKKRLKRNTDQDDAGPAEDNDQGGSSEFQSSSIHRQSHELQNLNPNEEEAPKRLRKSNKKSRLEDKEGFNLAELGNQPEVNYDDGDYSSEARGRPRKNKSKKPVPTNQQILNALKEKGVVEDEANGQNIPYDNGLELVALLKGGKKNSIKIANRMFGDIEIDARDHEEKKAEYQNLQLEIQPKAEPSIGRFSFLSKAEVIKKQRGLQADVNKEQYESKMEEKGKKSLQRIVSSMANVEHHDQLELDISVPLIARGKSAGIINNTVYLKNIGLKERTQTQGAIDKKQLLIKKEYQSRHQMFKQINEDARLSRSKHISSQSFKNSFKKTNLEQLEVARKQIQQKRRKQALGQLSENEEQQQHKDQMIEKEQLLCNKAKGQQINQQQVDPGNEGLSDEKLRRNQGLQGEIQQDIKNNFNQELSQQQNQVVNQQLEALQANMSQQQPEAEQEQDFDENEQQSKLSSPSNSKKEIQQDQQLESNGNKSENYHQLASLQEQGIVMRKNAKCSKQSIQDDYKLPQPDMEIQNKGAKDFQAALQNQEEFTNFKKLRKVAMVLAKKKKEKQQGRQYAKQFLQSEAEEGSDNEDHDDLVKKIDYAAQQKEYQGLDLDADLVELIDNAVDINQEDQFQAFRKYLEDVRLKDREQLKQIIRGEFRKKHEDLQIEMEQDERKRQQRMEQVMQWMKKREEEEGVGIYQKQPEEEERNEEQYSDEDGQQDEKEGEQSQQQENADQIPREEQMALLEKFIQNTLPIVKRQTKTASIDIDLGQLPTNIKNQRRTSFPIPINKIYAKNLITPGPLKKLKKTSSLVNQTLNKHPIKIVQKTFARKK